MNFSHTSRPEMKRQRYHIYSNSLAQLCQVKQRIIGEKIRGKPDTIQVRDIIAGDLRTLMCTQWTGIRRRWGKTRLRTVADSTRYILQHHYHDEIIADTFFHLVEGLMALCRRLSAVSSSLKVLLWLKLFLPSFFCPCARFNRCLASPLLTFQS